MNKECKILVVDDEQVIVDFAQRVLREEGFAVIGAPDAENARELLAEEAPEIVVTDLKLPGMSGLELLDVIKEKYPQILVIVITGFSSVDNAIASLKNGAFDFIPKPFTFDELLSSIHQAHTFLNLPGAVHINKKKWAAESGYYFFGQQSWAKPDSGGTFKIGLTPVLQKTIGTIVEIILPEINTQILQGGRLVQLIDADQLEHTVWAPLGGRVLEVNTALQQNPDVITGLTMAEAWVARIQPMALETELGNLRENL